MEEDFISSIQSLLRQRLSGKCYEAQNFRDQEQRDLYNLVEHTATMGDSNSILIVGQRGSGKTTLVNSVLQRLVKDDNISGNLITVRLNGLLQTDDKIALAEITRQLHLEEESEGKAFGSFAENLQFLLGALKSGGDKRSCSIVFVLDEFDLFTQHRNQTLLYNLFDVAQSAQAPICVIGLSVRMDVLELLEKRVKSRFSHRFIYLHPTFNFDDFIEAAHDVLSLPKNFGPVKYVNQWNNSVQEFIDDSSVIDVLRQLFDRDRNIRKLYSLLMYPANCISSNHPKLETADLFTAHKNLFKVKDDEAAILQGLPVLEMTLVLSMKHLREIYGNEPFNFEMVFNVYKKFTTKTSMQTFQKPVVSKAFEHLSSLEIVCPAETSSRRISKEYRAMNLMVDNSQILEAVKRFTNCPNELNYWASTPSFTL